MFTSMIDSRRNSCKIVKLYNITMYVLHVCPVMATYSNSGKAEKYARASLGISVAGIAVGVVVIIAVAVIATKVRDSCNFKIDGTCYRYIDPIDGWGNCYGVRIGMYCYHNHASLHGRADDERYYHPYD